MKKRYQEPRLMEQVKSKLRQRDCLPETQRAYCRVIMEFIRYHNVTHPKYMGYKQIEEFLDHLVKDLGRADSTRNKALNALLFLYGQILKRNTRGWHRGLKSNTEPNSPTAGAQKGSSTIGQMLFSLPRNLFK